MFRPRSALRAAPSFLALAVALALPTGASAATELFYATTPSNVLVSFTAQAPGRILSSEPISGLGATERIVGLDQRPATGQLYALTNLGRLLVVDRDSGDIKVITSTNLPLTGTTFGFDFNPVADRIRIVSDTDLNLRVNPDTGVDTADTTLAYAGGDAGAGSNPAVDAVGYTNSAFGVATPATTTLFGIDALRNSFVKIDPPNNGTLATVGALGHDAVSAVQLDIAGDGTQYAAYSTSSASSNFALWKIAATGSPSPAATDPVLGTSAITSLASVGQVTSDSTAPNVAVGNYTVYRSIWLSRGLRFTTACNEGCSVSVTLRIDGKVAGTASTTMPVAGTRAPRIRLTSAGRALAAASGNRTATLTFLTFDEADNSRTQVTTFISRRTT